MSKKCDSCKANNPDSAHYCGHCGMPLEKDWQNKDILYKVVKKSDYDSLENKCNSTQKELSLKRNEVNQLRLENARLKKKSGNNIGKKIKELWYDFKGDDSTFDTIWALIGIVVCIAFVLWFLYWLCFKAFAPNDKLERIQIEGKYGIGYSKDDMKVPALFDSISYNSYGSQWVLRNGDKYGMAYVTDSIARVIEPNYATYWRLDNGASILMQSDKAYDHYYNGLKVNDQPYKYVTWKSEDALVVQDGDWSYMFIRADGTPIIDNKCSDIVIDEDSVIRAFERRGSLTVSMLYDYDGNKLSDKEMWSIYVFSDGVAWAKVNKESMYSVIDRQGNILFTLPCEAYEVKGFNKEIGFYQPGNYRKKGDWTAVDKSGKVVFTLPKEWSIYAPSMGLWPVEDGNRNMGFIDNSGKTVIDFKYKKVPNYIGDGYTRFRYDSTMTVILDGQKGILHRNGTFTPNKD